MLQTLKLVEYKCSVLTEGDKKEMKKKRGCHGDHYDM